MTPPEPQPLVIQSTNHVTVIKLYKIKIIKYGIAFKNYTGCDSITYFLMCAIQLML